LRGASAEKIFDGGRKTYGGEFFPRKQASNRRETELDEADDRLQERRERARRKKDFSGGKRRGRGGGSEPSRLVSRGANSRGRGGLLK